MQPSCKAASQTQTSNSHKFARHLRETNGTIPSGTQFEQELKFRGTMKSSRLLLIIATLLSCVLAQDQSLRDRVDSPADAVQDVSEPRVLSDEKTEGSTERVLPYHAYYDPYYYQAVPKNPYFYYYHDKKHGYKISGKMKGGKM